MHTFYIDVSEVFEKEIVLRTIFYLAQQGRNKILHLRYKYVFKVDNVE